MGEEGNQIRSYVREAIFQSHSSGWDHLKYLNDQIICLKNIKIYLSLLLYTTYVIFILNLTILTDYYEA